MSPGRNQTIGKWGEDQACLFLHRQGFRVIERNFYTPTGEIDVVATKGGDYYFIEVKTRRKGELANDLSITPAKKYKFLKTIKQYCFKRDVTTGGFIFAGLLVFVDRVTRQVAFRLAVIY